MKEIEEIMKQENVSVLLNVMKLFSEDVYNHCMSVAIISRKLVESDSNFTTDEKNLVVEGALLHDIGKILVPFNLTELPRRLSQTEFAIVKTHTLIGYEMLKNDFPEIVLNIALYHHEQPNGSGYVGNIPLSRIPREALLVQVADVYDALVSKRRYKENYDNSAAVAIMKNDARNLKLDDEYLDRLQSIVGTLPIK